VVELNGISKKYGSEYAVYNITFGADIGEPAGVYGLKGAGKTTIADIITGCTYPSSGSVVIGGYDIKKDAKKAKRKIGYMPENPSLYADMTAEEYLNYVCALKRIPHDKIKQSAKSAMEKVGLKQESEKLIGGMESMEKRRLSLAAALCGETVALILDEPTVSLDPEQAEEMRNLIKPLCGDYAVILFSQNVRDISEICTSVILLDKGRIAARQPVKRILGASEEKRRVLVRLAADKKTGLCLLNGIEGAQSVECAGCGEKGTFDFIVESYEADLRPEIFGASSRAGLTLLGMNVLAVTIEDVLSQLAGNGGETRK
jgi:ABC-2 type transport system ATP-binding protein